MLYAIESGIKVKVKEGAKVNLKGVLKREYNPHELAVHKDEVYKLGLCKLYKDGVIPLETVLGINEDDYFTSEVTRSLRDLLAEGLIVGTPVEPDEPCFVEDILGNKVKVHNSNTLKLTDTNGRDMYCNIVPNNYKGSVSSIGEELANNYTVVLGLVKEGIGSNLNHEDSAYNDIEVCYSVFKECFEFVK